MVSYGTREFKIHFVAVPRPSPLWSNDCVDVHIIRAAIFGRTMRLLWRLLTWNSLFVSANIRCSQPAKKVAYGRKPAHPPYKPVNLNMMACQAFELGFIHLFAVGGGQKALGKGAACTEESQECYSDDFTKSTLIAVFWQELCSTFLIRLISFRPKL